MNKLSKNIVIGTVRDLFLPFPLFTLVDLHGQRWIKDVKLLLLNKIKATFYPYALDYCVTFRLSLYQSDLNKNIVD